MHQIGAVLYLAWGGLHLFAAYQIYKLGSGAGTGMVQGRIFQSAWNLAFVAIAVSGVAVALNWQNSPSGYWISLTATSVTDLGFLLFVLAPGYLPPWPGGLGPVLWVMAALTSTLGILGAAA